MVLSNPGYSDAKARASIQFGDLLVAEMQERPATGTATDPQKLNDNATGDFMYTGILNQYGEIRFRVPARLSQYRHFGHATSNGDGTWKIEYQDLGGAWHDWVVGIATRVASWTGFVPSGTITAIAIRMTATLLDSCATNYCGELEVKY
ncbi:unnamed protein product [marine sediment metagenome]|uniref:Uncharacterized protein n=1 Tax=marine sediment metagenome TaxID=412755 RepID=X1E8L9_9ZZZZ